MTNQQFEAIAKRSLDDTGIMAPGKSVRSEQVSVSKARQMFNRLDEHLRREGLAFITVTRHGETAFSIAAPEFIDTLLETLEILSDPKWAEKLRAAVADIQAGRTTDHVQVKKENDSG